MISTPGAFQPLSSLVASVDWFRPPISPGGSETFDGIETVTVSASRLPSWAALASLASFLALAFVLLRE